MNRAPFIPCLFPLSFYNDGPSAVGSRFTTGSRSRIFGCKSNLRKTSTI